jgi:amidase
MSAQPATRAPVDGFLLRLDVPPTAAGPLDGLTFGVKDLIDVAGTVTGCGNPTWAASRPAAVAHAVVVELLLNAGARCLGKTITDEFAFSLVGENYFYGTPLNPKAPDRVPGGSSAGSASVVAAGQVDFALGTDTAGSVRVPAANCGIHGLRPTWGRASMAGIQPLAPSFDTVGVFARDPAVLGRVADCLWPAEVSPQPIRRVLMLEQGWEIADADVGTCRSLAADQLVRAGVAVESIDLGALVDGGMGRDFFAWKSAFSGAQWPEVWSIYGSWLTAAEPELGLRIAENFANVKKSDRSGLAAGLKDREHARRALQAFLAPDVALCVPTTPSVAPVRGRVDYDRTGFGYLPRTLCLTAIAGLCGLPQLSVPFTTANGLPAGVSLIGAPDADHALIALAAAMCGP